MRILLKRYSPPAFVLALVLTPVAMFSRLTVTLGTADPEASTTVPTRLPSIAWLKPGVVRNINVHAQANDNNTRRISLLLRQFHLRSTPCALIRPKGQR